MLEAGNTHKNDPNDALSVAVAALRSKASRAVAADDHAAVLRMRGRRHRDLDQARNQVACGLHAVLAELVPGGLASEITTVKAEAIIAGAGRRPGRGHPPRPVRRAARRPAPPR